MAGLGRTARGPGQGRAGAARAPSRGAGCRWQCSTRPAMGAGRGGASTGWRGAGTPACVGSCRWIELGRVPGRAEAPRSVTPGVGFQVKCASCRCEKGRCSARAARIIPETLRRSCRKSPKPCADPHRWGGIGGACRWGKQAWENPTRPVRSTRVGSAQGFGDNPRSFNGQRRNSPGILHLA